MADHKEENEQDNLAPIDGGILLPDAAELARREQAERNRREERNQKFIVRLQRLQTRAQIAQARANAAIAKLTAALVMFAFVAGGVSWLQFSAAKQSSEAALSAVNVARDARDDSTISGGDTLIQMKVQSRAMGKSGDIASHQIAVMGDQLKALREQTEVSQRPWMVASDPVVNTDFPLLRFSSMNVTTSVRMTVQNIGHSPARGVLVGLSLSFSGSMPQVKALCEKMIKGQTMTEAHPQIGTVGYTIFPGKFAEPRMVYMADAKDEITKYGSVPHITQGADIGDYNIPSTLIGCVVYQSAFADTFYYTGFTYSISSWLDGSPLFYLKPAPDGTAEIPASRGQLQFLPGFGYITK